MNVIYLGLKERVDDASLKDQIPTQADDGDLEDDDADSRITNKRLLGHLAMIASTQFHGLTLGESYSIHRKFINGK